MLYLLSSAQSANKNRAGVAPVLSLVRVRVDGLVVHQLGELVESDLLVVVRVGREPQLAERAGRLQVDNDNINTKIYPLLTLVSKKNDKV